MNKSTLIYVVGLLLFFTGVFILAGNGFSSIIGWVLGSVGFIMAAIICNMVREKEIKEKYRRDKLDGGKIITERVKEQEK